MPPGNKKKATEAFLESTGPKSESSGNGRPKEVTEEDDGKERSSEGALTSSSNATQEDERKPPSLDDRQMGDEGAENVQYGVRFELDESDSECEQDEDEDEDEDGDDGDGNDGGDHAVFQKKLETPPQVHEQREAKRKYNRLREARLRQERREKIAKLQADSENAIREQQELLRENRELRREVTSFFQQNVSFLFLGAVPGTGGDSTAENASSQFSTNASASLQRDQHSMDIETDRSENITHQVHSRQPPSGMQRQHVAFVLPPGAANTGRPSDRGSRGVERTAVYLNHEGRDSDSGSIAGNFLLMPASMSQWQSTAQGNLFGSLQVMQDTAAGSLMQPDVSQRRQYHPLAIQRSPIEGVIEQSTLALQFPMQNRTMEQSSQEHPGALSQSNQSIDPRSLLIYMLILASREGRFNLNDPNTLEMLRRLIEDEASQQNSEQP